jgi:hypothetical protein
MSYLLIINGILLTITLLGVFFVMHKARGNQKHTELNKAVGDELQVIIQTAQKTLKSHRETHDVQPTKKTGMMDLEDPVMLSTLITVIVSKYGALRLNMKDFDTISEDEFVSVYVDTGTNELILSLNHNLGKPDSILAGFSGDDDTTFH